MILDNTGQPVDVEPIKQDSLSDWEKRRIEAAVKFWREMLKNTPRVVL